MAAVKAIVAKREREAVRAALADHSWRAIGEALGVSKQAVFQRSGREWVETMKASMKTKKGPRRGAAAAPWLTCVLGESRDESPRRLL